MAFIDEWQGQLGGSYAEFAALAQQAQEIDLTYGIIATAILWPVREELQEDEGYDALFELCGPKANQIIKAMRAWNDDPEAAARDLAEQAQANEKLHTVLETLIQRFEANRVFADYVVQTLVAEHGSQAINIDQIKAALVNVGGVQNIQSLYLTFNLGPPVAPADETGPPFAAPPLPSHFVERPTEYEAIRAQLVTNGLTPRIVGVQGGGGFGKTTLAAALCHDPQIKETFLDGILWVRLGERPNLRDLVMNQIKRLSRDPREYTDLDAAADRLRGLLAGKKVLMVLDDIWNEDHLKPFLAGSGTYLLTTRRQDVADVWSGGHPVSVNEMTTAEAAILLSKWLDKPPPDPHILEEFAAYLGEWPLLLELAAAQLRSLARGLSLDEAIKILREGLIEEGFTAFDRTRGEEERNKAIGISLEVSLKYLADWRERYLELAVFPEDIDIPVVTIERLWQYTGQLSRWKSTQALNKMQDLSLFTQSTKGAIRLHDAVRAYLVRAQAENLPSLHAQLVEAYRQDCPSGWATGPNDGYFYEHLTYHLAEAGQSEELYALIDKPWLEAKFKHFYSHRAFAEDVDLAIEVAGAEEPPNVDQVIRGSYIYATIGSLATNVPPEALGGLARVGQVERAEGYATLIKDAEQQSEAYRLIAQTLTGGQAELMWAMAIAAAEQIESSGSKASALSEIARLQAKMGEVTAALTTIERIKNPGSKASALSGIAQAQAEIGDKAGATATLKAALTTAERIGKPGDKASALSEIAQAQAEMGEKAEATATLKAALTTAERIERPSSKASALSKIAQVQAKRGDKAGATATLTAALTTTQQIREAPFNKASALSEIAQVQAEMGEVKAALTTTEKIWNLRSKASALSKIARLQAEKGDKAGATATLKAALTTAEQDMDLLDLLPGLGPNPFALSEIAQVQAEMGEMMAALTTAERIEETALRAPVWIAREVRRAKVSALSEIARLQAEGGEMMAALTTAERIEASSSRASALSVIARVQAERGDRAGATATLTVALTTAERTEDSGSKASALSEIARLQAMRGDKAGATATLKVALSTTEQIRHLESKASALRGIARVQAEIGDKTGATATLAAALTTAEQVGDSLSKASALIEIARLQAKMGEVTTALTTAEQIEFSSYKASALRGIARVQAEIGDKAGATATLAAALTTAEQVGDSWSKASALSEIARVQAEVGDKTGATATLKAALTTAEQMLGWKDKASALLSEIARVQAEIGDKTGATATLAAALATAEQIWKPGDKASALSVIARVQAERGDKAGATATLTAALTTAEQIGKPRDKASALREIARVQAEIGDKTGAMATLKAVLTTAEQIKEPVYKSSALSALSEIAQLQAETGEVAAALTTIERSKYLVYKASALSVVARVQAERGDRTGATATLAAALTTAEQIGDSWSKASALSKIAQLQGEMGEKAGATATLKAALTTAEQMRGDKAFALREIAQAQAELPEVVTVISKGRFLGRDGMFDMFTVLAGAVSSLAHLDEGHILLRRVVEVIEEVDGWWGAG